jgi:large subunit ribosomal protein L24
MQKAIEKVVRRSKNDLPNVRRAKINEVKKKTKIQAKLTKELRQNREEYARRINGVFKEARKEARKSFKEDWELGPLAPRRDAGDRLNTYGSIDPIAYRLPEVKEEGWKKWFPIAEGDRVVVMKGREKGKIGVVADDFDETRESVTVSGLNRHYVALPHNMRETNKQDVAPFERAYHIDDLRLVFPLPDPITGKIRDTIIDKLIHVPVITEGVTARRRYADNGGSLAHRAAFDLWKREQERGLRVIPGTNTVIPWVEKAAAPLEVHQGTDTPNKYRDKVTFEPSLIHAPMPLKVIDELRNKYSKFRARPEYAAKLAAIEAKKEAREARAIAMMTTPRQALAALNAAKSAEAAASRELNEAQLAKIGELMVQARQRTSSEVQS